MRLLDCAVGYVVGKVSGELRNPAGGQVDAAERVWRGLSADAAPHLAAAMSGGYGWDPHGEFERGLTALLRGWGSGD